MKPPSGRLRPDKPGEGAVIDLYFWTTDNGYKARQAVEETGLDYRIVPVNLREKEQFDPEFMKISPGHKIPAIVDPDGPGGARVTLCESGAILKYLAEKAGGALYPTIRRCARRSTSGSSSAPRPSPRSPSSSACSSTASARTCRPPRRITTACCATCWASSTGIWRTTNTSPATTRSPTSPPIRTSTSTGERDRPRRLAQRQALARRDRSAARGAARLGGLLGRVPRYGAGAPTRDEGVFLPN